MSVGTYPADASAAAPDVAVGRLPSIDGSDHCYRRALRFVGNGTSAPETGASQRLFRLSSLVTKESVNLTNEPADAAFVVMRGATKRIAETPWGESVICGVHFPGALISLATLPCADRSHKLVALEQTYLCRVRSQALPHAMQRELSSISTSQLRALYAFHLSLLGLSPRHRLAMLLLRVSAQVGKLEFQLSLPDSEVAEFLGCSLSDVTEGFQQLIRQGWITQERRRFRVLDTQALLHEVNANA